MQSIELDSSNHYMLVGEDETLSLFQLPNPRSNMRQRVSRIKGDGTKVASFSKNEEVRFSYGSHLFTTKIPEVASGKSMCLFEA